MALLEPFDFDLDPPLNEPESFDATTDESFQSDAGLRLVRTTMSMESRIQADEMIPANTTPNTFRLRNCSS